MSLFEKPSYWKAKEIHHIDPTTLPPLSPEEQDAYISMARSAPDPEAPWLIPVGNKPPWLEVPPPPLLKYPPFPKLSQDLVKSSFVISVVFFFLMSFKPALGGCFLILLIITIILFFYHKRVSLPDFSVKWRQVHLENSRHFENWQRERAALTRRWLSKMRARYELWKKLLIEDADMHFAHGDEIMKKLLFGREVNQSTAENLKRARKKELLKLAKEAEVIKDYTRAGNYYHKAGEVEKAKKMHELARGTRQYVQIGTIDRSITIKDSVVQRSKVGVEPAFTSPLAELYQLVEKGILTEEEFEKAKKKLLE